MTQKEFDSVIKITRMLDSCLDFIQTLKALDDEEKSIAVAILENTYSEMVSKKSATVRITDGWWYDLEIKMAAYNFGHFMGKKNAINLCGRRKSR